jgi:hypothetical protein
VISIPRAPGAAVNPKVLRIMAGLAIGTAVALSATGCAMISPQATTITYSAAEGVNIHGSGPLEVRNAFIVASADGSEGNFVGAIVNQTDRSHTLNLQFGEGSSKTEKTVRVPANSVVSLGTQDSEPLLIEGLDTLPGQVLPTYFQSGDAEGVLATIPVLDGQLTYLAPLVP